MDTSEVICYGSYIYLEHDFGLLTTSGFLGNPLYISPASLQKSIFRILPQFTYTVQEHLLEASINPDFKDLFPKMKGVLDGEITSNLMTFSSYDQQPVTFGSQVQLQHVYSNKFLTLSLEKHEDHRDKFKIYLSDFGNNLSVFTLQSAFKYQEEGSAFIKSGSKVLVTRTIKELDKVVNVDITEDFREILGSLVNKLPLTIVLYSADQSEGFELVCGDYIQLVHSEENQCLIGEKSLYDPSVIQPFFSKEHSNSNGIWLLENAEQGKGGVLFTDRTYNIRHVASGLYLTFEEIDENFFVAFAPVNWASQWILVQNKLTEKVLSERFYRLINATCGRTLGAVVSPLSKDTENYVPSLTEENLNVSYFRLKKSSESFVRIAQFLLACEENLNEFLVNCKRLFEEKNWDFVKVLKSFAMLKRTLTGIELFCENKMPKFVLVDVAVGEIDPDKQDCMKNMKFISSLTRVIQFFLDRQKEVMKNDSQALLSSEIKNVLTCLFKLIKLICTDKEENQAEAFENVTTYANFIGLDVGASELLISLVKNNEKLLYKIFYTVTSGSEKIISWFIHQLRVTFT